MPSPLEDSPTPEVKPASSPYATGGGGTTLEHRYGATVLAALLLEHAVPGLGDDFTVVQVKFQASTTSPVDDLVVTGLARRGQTLVQRTIAIGVRRNPTIGPSDEQFVKLLKDALETLHDDATGFEVDSHRISIVVAAPHPGAQETSELAALARSFPTYDVFYSELTTPGRSNAPVRRRFELLRETVVSAQGRSDEPLPGQNGEQTWRLLRALWMHQCRLEGDAADRTHCVQRLRAIVDTASDADALFEQLSSLAADFAKKGAIVDQSVLRRALSARTRITRARSLVAAWRTLDRLADSERERTPRSIRLPHPAMREIRFERPDARKRLLAKVREVAGSGGVLVVTGEPGTGKSALMLDVVDELIGQGAAVTMLNLRDLDGVRSAIQLEQILAASLAEVLGATAVSELRILVLDGCEVVQEGLTHLVSDFVRAADSAGLTLIAITRQDALENLIGTLRASWRRLPPGGAFPEEVVEGFGDAEVDALVSDAPALRRLAENTRSRWLLRRPGLLRLVLENDAADSLPDGPLCEADVYRRVWQKLVRRAERQESDGATPDGREAIAKALVRRLLLPAEAVAASYPDPQALPSLRRDGVLLPVPKGIAWRAGEEFASDLVRDIALFHVLLAESPQLLVTAGAPRWTLHAARVTFQALLHGGITTRPWHLSEVLSLCAAFARLDGERWMDVPWEAALTLPGATAMLENEWALLAADRGEAFRELMRVLGIRFGGSMVVDADAGIPVVTLLCEHRDVIEGLRNGSRKAGEDIVLRWLRSLALRGVGDVPDLLRARVRDDLILRSDRSRHDGYVESLGLLGPDLDATTEQRLRVFISDRPFQLKECVESTCVSASLSRHDPDLLLELAEAYYIEPEENNHLSAHRGPGRDGVRRHSSRHRGFAAPQAAWHYGPFWHLLNSRALRATVSLINRLLNHAARIRIEQGVARGSGRWRDEAGVDTGIDVELPLTGLRHFVGDSHVWRWYRGLGVGPYPCMSALLALEVFVDRLVADDIPMDTIIGLLMDSAESLAMAGFIYGLLVRYIEKAGNLLDPWLAVPDVWMLESRRHRDELSGFRFAQAGNVAHAGRHACDCMAVAYFLVSTAMLRGDEAQMERLAGVSARLVENARKRYTSLSSDGGAGAADGDQMLVFRRYASMLVAAHYQPVEIDGQIEIRYVEPSEIAQEMAQGREDTLRGQFLWCLQAKYGIDGATQPTEEDICRDLDAVIGLLEKPPQSGPPWPLDGPAALAMRAVEFHTGGGAPLTPDRLLLVIEILLSSVENRLSRHPFEDGSMYPMGADRSAARVLPLLLTSGFDRSALASGDWLEYRRAIVEALGRIARGPATEARVVLVEGLRSLWNSPCGRGDLTGESCGHRVALEMMMEAARYCRHTWDAANGQLAVVPLEGPLEDALRDVATEELLLPRLEVTIGALGDCVASACCVADEAYGHLGPMVTAYARTACDHEASWDSTTVLGSRPLVARSLLLVTATWGPALLHEVLDDLLRNPAAAETFLRDLCQSATYDANARRALKTRWPGLMDRTLVVWERDTHDGEWRQSVHRALLALIPRPRPRPGEDKIDQVLAEAYPEWVEPDALAPFMDRWIAISADVSESADAVVWFLLRRPLSERIRLGLPWLETIIGTRFDALAGRTWILWDWVKEIVTGDGITEADRARLRHLVDGAVTKGDRRALRLQQLFDGGP